MAALQSRSLAKESARVNAADGGCVGNRCLGKIKGPVDVRRNWVNLWRRGGLFAGTISLGLSELAGRPENLASKRIRGPARGANHHNQCDRGNERFPPVCTVI